jgi:hypothetical protein
MSTSEMYTKRMIIQYCHENSSSFETSLILLHMFSIPPVANLGVNVPHLIVLSDSIGPFPQEFKLSDTNFNYYNNKMI